MQPGRWGEAMALFTTRARPSVSRGLRTGHRALRQGTELQRWAEVALFLLA